MNFERIDSSSIRQIRRQIINSAIYVEKPLAISISNENTSVCHKLSEEDMSDLKLIRTKRCTCSTDQKKCPFHATHSSATFVKSDFEEEPTKKPLPKLSPLSLKTKISSTNSSISCNSNNSEKEEAIKQWLSKKESEKKERLLKEKTYRESLERQRQMVLEQERKNFHIWLANKKKSELDLKKKKEKEEEEKQLKELEKEKRQLQNKISFQLWIKKKDELQLEKKIEEQMKIINELEQKQKQIAENERAFSEWFENSKNKPKPIPLNKGLRSICSKSSLTYINPTPWNNPDAS